MVIKFNIPSIAKKATGEKSHVKHPTVKNNADIVNGTITTATYIQFSNKCTTKTLMAAKITINKPFTIPWRTINSGNNITKTMVTFSRYPSVTFQREHEIESILKFSKEGGKNAYEIA